MSCCNDLAKSYLHRIPHSYSRPHSCNSGSSSAPSLRPTAVGKRRRELRGSVCVPDSGVKIVGCGGCGRAFCVWCVGGCVCVVCVWVEAVVEDTGEAGVESLVVVAPAHNHHTLSHCRCLEHKRSRAIPACACPDPWVQNWANCCSTFLVLVPSVSKLRGVKFEW